MIFREAQIADIDKCMIVRLTVKENVLNNPALVPKQDYVQYINNYGKGWICEIDNQIVGFSIVSVLHQNVWALFVLPEHESRGIGKQLHDIMIDWYFDQTEQTIWLGTEQNTRAEKFYIKRGWKIVGINGENETKFEMTKENWFIKFKKSKNV